MLKITSSAELKISRIMATPPPSRSKGDSVWLDQMMNLFEMEALGNGKFTFRVPGQNCCYAVFYRIDVFTLIGRNFSELSPEEINAYHAGVADNAIVSVTPFEQRVLLGRRANLRIA